MKTLNVPLDRLQVPADFNLDNIIFETPHDNLLNSIAYFEPIAVKANSDGYEIVMGVQKYRAALLAGLTEIPVLVIPEYLQDDFNLALDNNGQRKLTYIERYVTVKLMLQNRIPESKNNSEKQNILVYTN